MVAFHNSEERVGLRGAHQLLADETSMSLTRFLVALGHIAFSSKSRGTQKRDRARVVLCHVLEHLALLWECVGENSWYPNDALMIEPLGNKRSRRLSLTFKHVISEEVRDSKHLQNRSHLLAGMAVSAKKKQRLDEHGNAFSISPKTGHTFVLDTMFQHFLSSRALAEEPFLARWLSVSWLLLSCIAYVE